MLHKELIEQIALETGILEVFIEKDWHVTELLKIVAEYEKETDARILFSGGTSLSKGHNIIQRFSEDVDMIVQFPGKTTRGQRRNFREKLREKINSDDRFEVVDSFSRDQSNFFQFLVQYKGIYKHPGIKDKLQIEMTFGEINLPPIECEINSMVSDTLKQSDNFKMFCVSPMEIAGDKLSALAWRILANDPDDKEYDKTLIRHLHDLSVLENRIMKGLDSFIACFHKSFQKDMEGRRGGEAIRDLSSQERLKEVLDRFNNNILYEKHYRDYIFEMSYADDDSTISFENALASLGRICKLVDSV